MCTVSFVPTAQGFRLAMNRDEKRTRVISLPPEVFEHEGRRAIYPREPTGGTWLAANDAGLCLILINWHTIEREPNGQPSSRGRIIPALAGAGDVRVIVEHLGKMELRNTRPFRLVVFASRTKEIAELRWDLDRLSVRRHPWQTEHWFSSGYDEPKVGREREKVCLRWNAAAGVSPSLRKLHASHLPRRGPFSICMHRRDAVTVSYAQVNVSARRVTLRYSAGSPCRNRPVTVKWLGLRSAL